MGVFFRRKGRGLDGAYLKRGKLCDGASRIIGGCMAEYAAVTASREEPTLECTPENLGFEA